MVCGACAESIDRRKRMGWIGLAVLVAGAAFGPPIYRGINNVIPHSSASADYRSDATRAADIITAPAWVPQELTAADLQKPPVTVNSTEDAATWRCKRTLGCTQ
jgi:hypothetical protein